MIIKVERKLQLTHQHAISVSGSGSNNCVGATALKITMLGIYGEISQIARKTIYSDSSKCYVV